MKGIIKNTAQVLFTFSLTINIFATEHIDSGLGSVWQSYTFIPLNQGESANALWLSLGSYAIDGQSFQAQLALPDHEFSGETSHHLPLSLITQYQTQAGYHHGALLHWIPVSIQMGSLLLLLQQASQHQLPPSPARAQYQLSQRPCIHDAFYKP